MKWNPLSRVKNVLGLAVDWRVRDVLEAEREATVELGGAFTEAAAHLTDALRLLEERVSTIESRLDEIDRQSKR